MFLAWSVCFYKHKCHKCDNVKTGQEVEVNAKMLIHVQVLQMIMANPVLNILLGSSAQGNQRDYPSASDFISMAVVSSIALISHCFASPFKPYIVVFK